MKIYQAVQKAISGGHTDRQAGDLITPFHFFESRLKILKYTHKRFVLLNI
jgi:hypothetical protein